MIFRKNRRLESITSRPSQSLEDIHQEYFADTVVSFDEFESLWHRISDSLEVPAEKLRPTDRFDYELEMFSSPWIIDLLIDFSDWVREELKSRGRDDLSLKQKDLKDVVLALAGRGAERSA